MSSPLLDAFESVVQRNEGRPALSSAEEEISFGQLRLRVNGVAAALSARGLDGERVGILCEGPGWASAFLGSLQARCTAVLLSPGHPLSELNWFAREARCRAVLVTPSEQELGSQTGLPLVDVTQPGNTNAPTSALRGGASADPAMIIYTSGSTGVPKGAVSTHASLEAQTRILREAWGFSNADRLLHVLPLHHVHGVVVSLLTGLLSGARLRMLKRFDAEAVWDEFEDSTAFMAVPTIHQRLLQTFDAAPEPTQLRWRKNLQRLRLLTSGSAALPPDLGERLRELTGQYPLERYGMTETGIVMSNPLHGERRPATVGVPLPEMAVRIVNAKGHDTAPGESGEIWMRGPTVFAGYDNDEAQTKKSFTDGWFRSGDTAVWEDGYCKILGRTSVDIIKSGGYKLSALEIEAQLRRHQAISQVAVVGVPHPDWGEMVVAAVVLVEGQTLNSRDLRDWAKERMASYKVPRCALFLPSLPQNAMGKIVKPDLTPLVKERLREAGLLPS